MNIDDIHYRAVATDRGVQVGQYRVCKITPKTYWVQEHKWAKPRKIIKGARIKFAHPTVKEAVESLYHRSLRRLRHCERNLCAARLAMENSLAEARKEGIETPVERLEFNPHGWIEFE